MQIDHKRNNRKQSKTFQIEANINETNMHNSKKGKNLPARCFFIDSPGKLKGTKIGKQWQIIEKDRRKGKKSGKEIKTYLIPTLTYL